jgi:hypothetical protein
MRRSHDRRETHSTSKSRDYGTNETKRKQNPTKWNEICKVRKRNPTKWSEICKVRKQNHVNARERSERNHVPTERSQVELQGMTQIKVGLSLNRGKTKASFQGMEKVQDLLKLSLQMLIAEPKGPICWYMIPFRSLSGIHITKKSFA